MQKFFIITVDTEGENGWTYHRGDEIHTECSLYLPRFQELCNKYGFKPVYLTNYEMICDERFVQFAKAEQDMNHCEVGIHVHAWNNPPLYELPNYVCDQSFLVEYPADKNRSKFRTTYELIKDKMGMPPVSHRAGRWVMNSEYFKILEEHDIKVDCSYTPHVDWSNTMGAQQSGPNYTGMKEAAHWMGKVLEVPTTVYDTGEKTRVSKRRLLKLWLHLQRRPHAVIWLRPASSSLEQMKHIIDVYSKYTDIDYVEFMVHSSELMPGGSPYFIREKDIEQLYHTMDELFKYVIKNGYIGCSLKEYYEQKN